MKIPFLDSQDKCDHETINLIPQTPFHQAQWSGGGRAILRKYQPYLKICEDCGESVSTFSHDANGELGREILEEVIIPAEVVDEYRK